MNPIPDMPDPFQKSLADQAADLPFLAAKEARTTHARRLRRQVRVIGVAVTAVLGFCGWQVARFYRPEVKQVATVPAPAEANKAPAPNRRREFVKFQTREEAMAEPVEIPPGATPEQKKFLELTKGLPLLLVLDESGKLTRIHVIER